MKILLTGSQGQVGQAIIEKAKGLNIHLISCDRKILDITDIANIQNIVEAYNPTAIINTAAYTAVDKAESEPEKAFAVNSLGAENLAKISAEYNIFLLHLSTDYIFDGEKTLPYSESDPANPIGIYAKSKWAGEEAVRKYCKKYIILRISWVFGEYGNNFVKTMLRLMKERESLQIVSDQTGCPTYTGDIAEVILKIITKSNLANLYGTYHYTNTPSTNWFEFAQAIYTEGLKFETLKTKKINPIKTTDYPTPAKRPKNSVLNTDLFQKTFKLSLQPWQNGLEKTLAKVYSPVKDNQTG